MSVEWSGEGGGPLHSHCTGTFRSPYFKTDRGIGTETCGVSSVFPPDDLGAYTPHGGLPSIHQDKTRQDKTSSICFNFYTHTLYFWIAVFI